jgi:hypothetical protein
MHPRKTVLLQASTAIAAIILTYVILTLTTTRSRRSSPLFFLQNKENTDISRFLGCSSMPFIELMILSKDITHTRRLVQTLNTAAYGHGGVNLTIFCDKSLVQELSPVWTIGGFKFATRSLSQLKIRNHSETMVVVMEDHLQPSPLFALWFIMQRCTINIRQLNSSAIAGGGDSFQSISGLAMEAETWNRFIRWTLHNRSSSSNHFIENIASYISSLPNASIFFPSNNVFVRTVWQNPVYVEQPPILVRTWDPAKTPLWNAVEVRKPSR